MKIKKFGRGLCAVLSCLMFVVIAMSAAPVYGAAEAGMPYQEYPDTPPCQECYVALGTFTFTAPPGDGGEGERPGGG